MEKFTILFFVTALSICFAESDETVVKMLQLLTNQKDDNAKVTQLRAEKEYLEELALCEDVVDRLNLIEDNFYYRPGRKEELRQAQITLCRLAISLRDVLNQGDGGSSADQSKRGFDSIMAGADFKRGFDSIMAGADFKRGFDSIGFGPIGMKKRVPFDRIATGPVNFKRTLDRIATGPIDLRKRNAESDNAESL